MTFAAHKRTLSSLQIGETAALTHQITEEDVMGFSVISGDHNPLHVDENYARSAGFKARVVHGFFLASLVSQLVGMHLPGAYALLVRESLEFKRPAFIDDVITVKGTIAAKSDSTKIIELSVEITRSEEVLAAGSVHVRVLQ